MRRLGRSIAGKPSSNPVTGTPGTTVPPGGPTKEETHPGAGAFGWLALDRFTVLLAIILAAGAALQGFIATSLWAMDDEGAYLQAGLALSHGSIPLLDFAARPEPVLPLLLVPAIYLFGPGVATGRAVMVATNLITATLIALLTRRLATNRGQLAGPAAAAAYLLVPWAATQGPVVLEEPVTAMFLVASLLLLLRQNWRPSAWNYPISGLLLGIAILSRRSAVAVGVVWLAWLLYSQRTWRRRVVETVRCLAPGVAIVGGFLAYVAWKTSFTWVILSVTVPTAAIEYVPSVNGRLGVVAYMMLLAAPLFLAPIVIGLRMLRARGHSILVQMATVLSVSAVAVLFATYPFFAQWGLGQILTPWVNPLLEVTLAFWLAMVVREAMSTDPRTPVLGRYFLLVAGWALAILALDFFARAEVFGVYFSDALAPLAILFGLWFVTLVPERTVAAAPHEGRFPARAARRLRSASGTIASVTVVVLLVVSSLLVAILVLGPTNPNNVPGVSGFPSHTIYRLPPAEIVQVGDYLRTHVAHGQTIFSFDTGYLDPAGLQITPQIAQYLDDYVIYLHDGLPLSAQPYPGSPSGYLPSVDGLMNLWNQTNLTWFVTGPLTDQALGYSPVLHWYFTTLYHPVRSFGDPLSMDLVTVMERGPVLPSSMVNGTSQTLTTRPASAVSANGTTYVVSFGASNVTWVRDNGSTGSLPLAFVGARLVDVHFGDLWVASAQQPIVEIIPLNGGPSQTVTVGQSPSAFSADTTSGRMFVASFGSGVVTALGMANGSSPWKVLWTSGTGTAIEGLAVDPNDHAVFASLPFENSIESLNETTGATLAVRLVPFSPYALDYADGGLDATWWGHGTVYRLNVTAGIVTSVALSFVAGGTLMQEAALPSWDAIAVPTGSNITILQAGTLLRLGTFASLNCSTGISWDDSTGVVAMLDPCQNQLLLGTLPSPHWLTIAGPPGSNVTLNGNPLATLALPNGSARIALWPETVVLTLNAPGHLPGVQKITFYGADATVEVPPGPSIAGVHSLRQGFAMEVVVAGVAFLIGGVYLLFLGVPEEPWTFRPPEEEDRRSEEGASPP